MHCPHCGAEIDQTDSLFETTVARPAAASAGPAGNGKARRSVRCALPKDWKPSPELEKYCRQQGKDPADFLEKFTSHYLAKGTVWKDWGLVWMKACREWTNPQAKTFGARLAAAAAPLVTPQQPPRPVFVPEHPDVREAALIVSYRKVGRWADANRIEEKLAMRQGRPPVLVPAPEVAMVGMPPKQSTPRRAPVITDIEPEWDAIPEGDDALA